MTETVRGQSAVVTASRGMWVVAGAALAAALVMVFLGFERPGAGAQAADPYHYGQIARGFVEHGFDRVTRRAAMLYPHLLAIIYWFGGNNLVAQLFHCGFHTGTAVLVFLLGHRLFNLRTGVLAGLFTAVHPMLLRYVPDLHTEAMLVFVLTLTVWCTVRFYDRPTVGNGILLGAAGMIGTLTKGVVLPVVLAFVAVWFVQSVRRQRRLMKPLVGALAIGLTMAAIVAPWTYRNYRVSGRFVLLTPGTADAFLRGYIFTRLEFATLQKPPYTVAENQSNAWFRRIAREAGTTWELDEIVDEDNNKRVMKQMIVQHPVDTARKFVVGLFTFWYEMTNLRNSLVAAVLALTSWMLALVGLKRARAEGRPAWLVLLPIVVVNVFVAALIPLGRYSVPILPCLTILAAFGVDTLLTRRRAVRTERPVTSSQRSRDAYAGGGTNDRTAVRYST
jgi:4-amino-4-deoxy-L-arabinose transferase-like glycosyltransferase